MKWYYRENDKDVGPLSQTALEELYQCGVIKSESPIRKEDSDDWGTYADAFPSKNHQTTETKPDSDVFKFHCIHCDQKISAQASQIGKKTQCPACNGGITVPDQSPQEAASEPREQSDSKIFKFYCPLCGQKMAAKMAHIGKTFCCPACNGEITVPDKDIQASAKTSTEPTTKKESAEHTTPKKQHAANKSQVDSSLVNKDKPHVPIEEAHEITSNRKNAGSEVASSAPSGSVMPPPLPGAKGVHDVPSSRRQPSKNHHEKIVSGIGRLPEHVKTVIPYAVLLLGLGHILTWILPDNRVLISAPSLAIFILGAPALLLSYVCAGYFLSPKTIPRGYNLVVFLFTATIGIFILLCMRSIGEAMLGETLRGVGGAKVIAVQLLLKAVGWLYQAIESPNFFVHWIGMVFGVGLLEEMTKVLPLLLYIFWGKKHPNKDTLSLRQFLMVGLFSGLGFGFTEAIIGYAPWTGDISLTSNITRWYACVPSHALYTVIDAAILWRVKPDIVKSESWSEAFFITAFACLCVAAIHGTYNVLAGIAGLGFIMDLVSLVLLSIILKKSFKMNTHLENGDKIQAGNTQLSLSEMCQNWAKTTRLGILKFSIFSLAPIVIVYMFFSTAISEQSLVTGYGSAGIDSTYTYDARPRTNTRYAARKHINRNTYHQIEYVFEQNGNVSFHLIWLVAQGGSFVELGRHPLFGRWESDGDKIVCYLNEEGVTHKHILSFDGENLVRADPYMTLRPVD